MAQVNISYVDPNHVLDTLPLLETTLRAAVAYLDTFVVFKGTLDIRIQVQPTSAGRFEAYGDTSYAGLSNGLKTWEAAMVAESRQGVDPHPQTPDFTINIDPSGGNLDRL